MAIGFDDFLRWEEASRDTIDVKRAYIDVAEDLVAGILLSQIVFWFLPSSKGKTKLRVKRDGKFWLAKGREHWWDECRISPKQFDRAIKVLVEKGLVEKQLFKFGGIPTVHIRLHEEVLLESVNSILTKGENGDVAGTSEEDSAHDEQNAQHNPFLPKGENGISPKVKTEFDQRGKSLTEITNRDHLTELNNSYIVQNELSTAFDEVGASVDKETDETHFVESNDSTTDSSYSTKNIDKGNKGKRKANKNLARALNQSYPPDFETFWKEYPRKEDKIAAFEIWLAIVEDKSLNISNDDLIAAAQKYRVQMERENRERQHIKLCKTWMNQSLADYLNGDPEEDSRNERLARLLNGTTNSSYEQERTEKTNRILRLMGAEE